MSLRTLQYAEEDSHEPDLKTLAKLASGLGVPPWVLMDEHVSPEAYRFGQMMERLKPEDRSVVVGMVERLGLVA